MTTASDVERLSEMRTVLQDARDELARWGWGDMHYGEQPQEQSVVDTLAKIDAVLGEGAPSLIELGFTRVAICSECGHRIFQHPTWSHFGHQNGATDDHKAEALLGSIRPWNQED